MNISIFAENSFAHQSGRIQVQRNGVELELPECENWSWKVLGWPIRPARTNIKTRCPFHHRGLECKSRKSRDTWSNRQVWPWSTEWSRTKANRVLPEKALLIANTLFQQHKRILYTWTSPDGQQWNQIDFIFAAKGGEALYSQQK